MFLFITLTNGVLSIWCFPFGLKMLLCPHERLRQVRFATGFLRLHFLQIFTPIFLVNTDRTRLSLHFRIASANLSIFRTFSWGYLSLILGLSLVIPPTTTGETSRTLPEVIPSSPIE